MYKDKTYFLLKISTLKKNKKTYLHRGGWGRGAAFLLPPSRARMTWMTCPRAPGAGTVLRAVGAGFSASHPRAAFS